MDINNERFPPTPAGIRLAIKLTPIDGFWEELIDWSQSYIVDDETLALKAVALAIRDEPHLFSAEQKEITQTLMEQRGLSTQT